MKAYVSRVKKRQTNRQTEEKKNISAITIISPRCLESFILIKIRSYSRRPIALTRCRVSGGDLGTSDELGFIHINCRRPPGATSCLPGPCSLLAAHSFIL